MKRRTQITIERQRLLLINARKLSAVGWCSSCDRNVQMVSAETAARQKRVTLRDIFRSAEQGLLHFTETQEGLLLICTDSLK